MHNSVFIEIIKKNFFFHLILSYSCMSYIILSIKLICEQTLIPCSKDAAALVGAYVLEPCRE